MLQDAPGRSSPSTWPSYLDFKVPLAYLGSASLRVPIGRAPHFLPTALPFSAPPPKYRAIAPSSGAPFLFVPFLRILRFSIPFSFHPLSILSVYFSIGCSPFRSFFHDVRVLDKAIQARLPAAAFG